MYGRSRGACGAMWCAGVVRRVELGPRSEPRVARPGVAVGCRPQAASPPSPHGAAMASLNCMLCGGSNAARGGGPGGCRCLGQQDAPQQPHQAGVIKADGAIKRAATLADPTRPPTRNALRLQAAQQQPQQPQALSLTSGGGPDLTIISGVGKKPSKRARPAAADDDLPAAAMNRKAQPESSVPPQGGGPAAPLVPANTVRERKLPGRKSPAMAAAAVPAGGRVADAVAAATSAAAAAADQGSQGAGGLDDSSGPCTGPAGPAAVSSRKRKGCTAEPGAGGGGGSGQIALAADALQLPRCRLVAAAASAVAIGAPDGDAQCFKCGRTAADIVAGVQAPMLSWPVQRRDGADDLRWPGAGPIKAVFGVWCCRHQHCRSAECNSRAERPSAAWAALSLAAGADHTENRHPASHYGRSQRVTPTSVSRCNYCARKQNAIPRTQLAGNGKLSHDMCVPGTYKCKAGARTKHNCRAKASGGRANFHETMGGRKRWRRRRQWHHRERRRRWRRRRRRRWRRWSLQRSRKSWRRRGL